MGKSKQNYLIVNYIKSIASDVDALGFEPTKEEKDKIINDLSDAIKLIMDL